MQGKGIMGGSRRIQTTFTGEIGTPVGATGENRRRRGGGKDRDNVTVLRAVVLAVTLASGSFVPSAAFAGAPEGEVIARKWCAGCHVVSADQATAVEGVPSFADIAGRLDDDAIQVVLFQPHPPMPEFDLSKRTVDDLVAYIRSQGG
jgi:mono/diheme cytochrome c family protein